MVLPGRRGLQVLQGGPDLAGGEGRGDLDLPALEKVEEALGVLLFLVGRLLENRADLVEPVLPGLAREVSIPVPGLRFPREGPSEVLFGFRPFQISHRHPPCLKP